jgi:membrane associated rhomboid family serine protease
MEQHKQGIRAIWFLWPSIWLGVLWFIFLVMKILAIQSHSLALIPGSFNQWWGIWTFTLVHSDFNHIFSNTVSLFFVGVLIRYSFPRIFDIVWISSFALPGLGMWFFARPSYHLGASAWLYALVFFVFFSGILRKHKRLLAQSMLMVFLYGSFVWGLLPHDPHISWEGHSMGALVGFFLAVFFRNEEPIADLKDKVYVHEEVEWDDWKTIPQDDDHIP